MRNFGKEAGSRNDDENKWDFEGFFSPIVMDRFAAYMHENRIQADGEIRDSDNWQKHFGKEHFSVCMKSWWRHFIDAWKEHRGYKSRDGMEEALMGALFNNMAYADKYFKDKYGYPLKK